MKFKNTLTALVVCLGLGALPGVSSAAFLTGAISFGGQFVPFGDVGFENLSDATGISILGGSSVGLATGDFAGLSGEIATFSDIEFNPANTPITPLWEVASGGINYSFDLTAIQVDTLTDNLLNLSGSGMLMADGFDDTAGSWVFSGDSDGGILFSFSSITGADPSDVPEPASLLLLGAGLLGFAAARRRRAL